MSLFRKERVVAILPEIVVVREYSSYSDSFTGKIIGYELRWKIVKERY